MQSNQRPMDINGKPYNRAILVAVLTVGSFFTMLTGTFLATAYPAIMRSFDISTSTVQWLTTSFMLVTGIMIPISAWLINKLNSRVMYISAMATFLIGTIIAFTAPNFGLLLTGRVIQSIGVGVSMPLNQTVMLSIFPPEKRGAAMGVVGVAMGLAPAVGPTMSGLIVDNWSWRDLFGIMIPAIVIVIALALVYMKPVLKVHQQPMDLWSIITSTVGFGGLLYGVSEASNRGWGDALVLSCIVIGIIFIVLFAHRQLHLDDPFLDLTVFKYGEFTLAAVLSSAVNLAMVGVEMLLPGALMLGLMSPVTGRLFDRYGARFLSITGLTLLIIGTVPFLTLTKNTPVISIVVFYAIRLFGVSMVFMPVTTSGMNVLPITEMAHGTAVNNTFRQTMSSIGTAIMTTVLTNVTNMQKPTHALLEKAPLSYKDHYINATLAGFHAAFLVAALFAVISLILAFFLKNGNRAREIALQQQKGE